MIKNKLPYIALSVALASFGCEINETVVDPIDTEPPAVPRGVVSTTGDQEVFLSWFENGERDLNGYNVYRSDNATTNFSIIATLGSNVYTDRDVINGETYYYAVTAFDFDGNESDLSPDLVHDTPRPEGYGERIFDFNRFPEVAGYDFSTFNSQHFQHADTDIYFEYHPQSGGHFINTFSDDTDIQDYGYTESMDDVSYAPDAGWSELGYVEAIPGHTYIFWTHDNHYAKIRVVAVDQDFIEFDWAYQVDEGNPELLAVPKVTER